MIDTNNRQHHGKRGTKEYISWMNMRNRCNCRTNPNYKYYGAKGIQVCPEWNNFPRFLSDMGEAPTPEHTIDRIDNKKGYSPDNCRWATRFEQRMNQEIKTKPISGFTGVYWAANIEKWRAYIGYQRQDICLGFHETTEQAAIARDQFIIDNGLPHKLQVLNNG